VVLLDGWVALNAADWVTTTVVLAYANTHGDNPLQDALFAHGGLVALAA
jgi:hypothetical protein